MSTEAMPAPDTITCPKCGRTNPAGNRFCGNCGGPLPVPASAGTPTPAEPKPAAVAAAPETPAAGVEAPVTPRPRPVRAPVSPLVAAAQSVGEVNVPDDPIARERERERLLSLANVQRMRAQIVDARKTLEQALVVSQGMPGSQIAPIHEIIGDMLAAEERWEQAGDAYEKAHLADPKRASAEKKYGEMALRAADEKALGSLGVLSDDGIKFISGSRAKRNPGFAMILSLIVPGFGQFYNGDFLKGAICLGAFVLSMFLITLTPDIASLRCLFAPSKACHNLSLSPLTWFCLIVSFIAWVYGLIDAPLTAAKSTEGFDDSGRPPIDKTGWEV